MEIVFEHGTDPRLAGGFTQLPNCVLRSPKLTVHAKCVYALLLSYAWEGPKARPSYERMQQDLQLSQPTITKALNELKSEKLVDWKRRGHGLTNLYIILAIKGEVYAGKNQTIFGSEPKEVGSRTKGDLVLSNVSGEDSSGEDPEGKEALALFDEFWKHYPRKDDKAQARKVFLGKSKLKDGSKMGSEDRHKALEACKLYGDIWSRAPKDRLQFRKMPSGWLRDRRWEDDPELWRQTAGVASARQPIAEQFKTEDPYEGGRKS